MGALAQNLSASPGCAASLRGESKYLQLTVGPAAWAPQLIPCVCQGGYTGPGAVGDSEVSKPCKMPDCITLAQGLQCPGTQLLLHVVKEAFTHHPPPVFLPRERMGQPGSEKRTPGSLNLAIAFPIC